MNTDTLTQHGRAIYAGDILVAQVFTEADKGIPESAAFLGREKTLETDCQGDAAARLFAAAPDLLAALEYISRGDTMGGKTDYTHADVIQRHYQICRNAIAKAKGETL